MENTLRAMLDDRPMHWRQIVIVALCMGLNALDGFDVLAISFASPGIAAEWHIDRAVLGIVLSMELFGMAAGSVVMGNLADRIGRRPSILACLSIMIIGMFLATQATSVTSLSAIRLFTGLGIGGMLASTSAIVAEFSNARRRSLNAALNIAGYSTGAVVGGLIASALLAHTGDWRTVFWLGGAFSALFLPLAAWLLFESIDSLVARRPSNALGRINRTLARFDMPMVEDLPARTADAPRPSVAALLTSRLAPLTLLLTGAYFAQIMAFYYIQKWLPKLVVDMGFDAASAGRVLVAANVGSASGAVAIGLVSMRLPLRPVIIVSMGLAFLAISSFGLVPHTIAALSVTAAIAGFFTNSAVVGLYPIFARTFPAELRASGTGFVIGFGRGGSALGPVVAGALLAGGVGLLGVSATMGAGALIAAIMLALLPFAEARRAQHGDAVAA